MRKLLKKSKFTTFAAAVLLLAAVPKVGWGQSCPTLPGDCNLWNHVTLTTAMNGTPFGSPDSATCGENTSNTCCISITFCYECCNRVIETYLISIIPGSSGCADTTPQQMIDFADWYIGQWALYEYLGGGGECDPEQNPCDQNLIVDVYSASCWYLASDLTAPVYVGCEPDTCYCQTAYNVEWCDGVLTYGPYNTTRVGSCVCTPAPPPGTPWALGPCYTINCPNGKGGD